VTVYTDGSCHDNGSTTAKCGSGLWYGVDDQRNMAIRVGPPIGQSNNTGEVVAVMKAIQLHRDARTIEIVSDSQYTIDIITKHAKRWLDVGLAGVKNKQLVRALIGEL
ncbi:ribonuclease H-like protein, partial [Coprinellus micaceus]